MNEQVHIDEETDSTADAIAAIALIVIFIATCIFWISSQ